MPLPNSWMFQAIGTSWDIQSDREIPAVTRVAIQELIELFTANYSRFEPKSIVRRMNKEPGVYTFSEPRFPGLYALYKKLYDITNGGVNPLIGDILVKAGYDERYKLRSFSGTSSVKFLDLIQWDGSYTVITDARALLDFGAAAKGLLVDEMAKLLRQSTVTEWFIDGSGDSMHHAKSSYTIGFEHPLDTTKLLGSVELQNESLCASAVNRRAWKNGHHVIDGRTGQPTHDIIASWVIASSTMVADGVATALFFEWSGVLTAYPDAAFLRMNSSGTIEMNQNMKERITLFSSND